ncbi:MULTISPECIES: hypothetical protein [unclassified Mesotoga]|uniref:hypothetical protein n=1 Tax=unclassified Mesotoga TaxID=1184398 RepID=UPI0011C4818E|nr:MULTISPECIES: hypothetical protein [unclassified Mesotoga]MDD5683916.1 hypothetical protein [Mesotoga sp.]MDI9367066.1 hypothetical protein [Thermotogota bacterium]
MKKEEISLKTIAMIFTFLVFFAAVPGLTLRAGIEGPAIIGFSLELDSGIYCGVGAIPPITIFGSGGRWSFSLTGGYSSSFEVLRREKMIISAIARGCAGAIFSGALHLAAMVGMLLEIKWSLNPSFKTGFQLGMSLGMYQRITNPETSFVPMGQIGVVFDF